MATNAPAAQQEEQGTSWFRTILNAVMVYFAISAVMNLVGGRFGGQKQSSGTSDAPVKSGTPQNVQQIPALWELGTKMV